ncbi:hypothetical protein [Nocardia sp. NPDC057030]|uniref:hypothetical protein n=1 Tax=unclassified Nocardia TaxID=2637762 RepID=UPI0036317DD2
MEIKKVAMAVTFALAATGASGGAAHAMPAPVGVHPSTVRGSEHDMTLEASAAADGKSLSADLFGGTFVLTDNAVRVTDHAGAVVADLPLIIELDQGTIELRPRLDATGAHLTAEPIGHWRQTSPKDRSIQNGLAIGAFTGALTGSVIGLAIGIAGAGVLALLTLPLGLLGGALLGGAIGAGIGATVPNSDTPDQWDYIPDPNPDDPQPDPSPRYDPWKDCSSVNHSFDCR